MRRILIIVIVCTMSLIAQKGFAFTFTTSSFQKSDYEGWIGEMKGDQVEAFLSGLANGESYGLIFEFRMRDGNSFRQVCPPCFEYHVDEYMEDEPDEMVILEYDGVEITKSYLYTDDYHEKCGTAIRLYTEVPDDCIEVEMELYQLGDGIEW